MIASHRAARIRLLVPLVAAISAVAVPIAHAPSAHALTSDVASTAIGCRDSGGAKVCQKPGHASLHTSPTVRAPSGGLMGSAWLPGYGRGHLPPLIAMD